MSRFPALFAIVAGGAIVAGCCCDDPCRPRCSPCGPAVAYVTEAQVPQNGMRMGSVTLEPAGAETHVIQLHPDAQGNVVVTGPDGKPMTIQIEGMKGGKEGVKVVQKDGQTVIFITEGEEGDEKGEEHGKAEHHRAPAPAPEAKPAPHATASPPAKEPAPAPAAEGERAYTGFPPVPVALVPADARQMAGIKAEHGVVVANVLPGGPAAKAGLKPGDVLVKFAGHEMPSDAGLDPSKPETAKAFMEDFLKIASAVRPGATVELVVERDGKTLTLKATAIPMDEIKKIAPKEEDEDGEEDEGKERHEGHEKD